MKGKWIALAGFIGLGIAAGSWWYDAQPVHSNVSEDSAPDDRAIWMKKRLMDPETGEIPEGIFQSERLFAKALPKQYSASRSGNTFLRRGPFNVGGRTRALAVDATNSSVLLAGGVSGGLYRSSDNGFSWTKTNTQDQMHNVTCLTQDLRNGKQGIWYYGTGEGIGTSASAGGSAYLLGNGVYKSTDGGNSWSLLTETAPNEPRTQTDWSTIWELATDPSNTTEDEVYAAVNGAIMRSVDGGATWTRVLGGGGFGSRYAQVKVTSSGVVYAAIGNANGATAPGIYRSADGINYTKIQGASVPTNFQRIVFDFSSSNEDMVYFLMRTPGVGSPAEPGSTGNEFSSLFKYTYLSGDGSGSGGKWENRSASIPSNNNLYKTFDTQGNYNMMVKVHPSNPNVVFIGSTNLFRSGNGFASTSATTQIGGYNPDFFTNPDEYRYPEHHPDQHNLVFPSTNTEEVYSANDGGVMYTSNSAASKVVWESRNFGFYTTQFYTIAVDHQGVNEVLVGGLQDNGTQFGYSNDLRTNWTDPLKSDGSYCAVSPGVGVKGAGIYYFSSQYGRTFKVTMGNNGVRNSYQQFNYPGDESNYSFVNVFELDYNNSNMMYMAFYQNGSQIIKKHDRLNQVPQNNQRSPSTFGWSNMPFTINGTISHMVSTRYAPDDRLYVGCENGKVYRVDGASGNSPSLVDISSNFPYRKGSYVSQIAVDPTNGDKLIVVFSNYNTYSVYYSIDAGASWMGIAGNLEEELPDGLPDLALGQGKGPSVRSAAIAYTNDGPMYFVGTSTGLYATNLLDSHRTVWVEQAHDLIGNVIVEQMDIRDGDNYLGIATHGAGAFCAYIETTDLISGTEALERHETEVKLFPNPAQNTTTLQWEAVEGENYTVELYDQSGKHVRRLFEGQTFSAQGELTIDVSQLEKGLYYCTLNGKEMDRAIKLVVTH
ncbi:T9SS type A sorting domain-containing protein [bacterium SCSIO 12741]|nr:T9SS type A sorting domain-containing protein [bacterium SCSIO 12741]